MADQIPVNLIPYTTIFSPNREIGKKNTKIGKNDIITFIIVPIYINMHWKKKRKAWKWSPEKKKHMENHRHK